LHEIYNPSQYDISVNKKKILHRSVIIIGSTTIDEIHLPEKVLFKIGGVTVYSGMTYQNHGIHTTLITNIAVSHNNVLKNLLKENLSVSNGRTANTTHFIHHIDKKRDIIYQEIESQADPITFDHILKHIRHDHVIHLGPLYPEDIETAHKKMADLKNQFICLDVQGLLRGINNKRIYPLVSDRLSDMLEMSTIVKANEIEHDLILRHYGQTVYEIMALFDINEWIVTAGNKGGFIYTLKGNQISYTADRTSRCIDPTGAGDVFFAAYLAKRLWDSKDINASARHAATIAAKHVAGKYIRLDQLKVAF